MMKIANGLKVTSLCLVLVGVGIGAAPAAETPNATIVTEDLRDFDKQPKKVRQLIQTLLELTTMDLGYKYGSADPEAGGMDCSGTMYYALRQHGFDKVPRMANLQYRWIWEEGRFYAVVSENPKTFELSRMMPGDMLFWSGTYDVDRDPPVTHAMIFLGWLKKDGRAVMVGASNGRSYEGKARNGVSVFDFRMPRKGGKARFVGYGRLPGLSGATEKR
ncbi:MAG: C40 family peptidase [Verrucomicrobiales bacterium]